MTQTVPGQAWVEIIRRPTLAEFAAAFSPEVALETSAGTRAIVGAAAIRHFFDATRAMYDHIAFVHETSAGDRTVLEWAGQFQGGPIAGATILTRDADGRIAAIQLYHRPYRQVLAFAAELAVRLEGKLDSDIFLR